jgi:hypothetical protein
MTRFSFDFDGERYAVEFSGAIDMQVAAGVLCLAGVSDDFHVHRVDSLGPTPESTIVALIEDRMSRAAHGEYIPPSGPMVTYGEIIRDRPDKNSLYWHRRTPYCLMPNMAKPWDK